MPTDPTPSLQALTGGGIVWDNHACMPLRPGDQAFLPQLERCRAGGIDVVSLNIGFGEHGIAPNIGVLATFRDWIATHPDKYVLVLSAADAREAKASGRLGICFDIESMNALGGQLHMVRLFYDLGVRWMLTTYNVANAAGGGCIEEDTGGLTQYGRQVIAEMNKVGMVLCGTHTGYRTVRDMIDASADPIIFSHSNPRAMYDHPRNVPDDLLRAVAARGGVVGINGIGKFLGNNDIRTETFVAHVEYALDLIGDDHVGIALDYVFDQQELQDYLLAHPDMFPASAGFGGDAMAMIGPERLPEIAVALAARGHSTETLGKLFGGNHLRIAERVWR